MERVAKGAAQSCGPIGARPFGLLARRALAANECSVLPFRHRDLTSLVLRPAIERCRNARPGASRSQGCCNVHRGVSKPVDPLEPCAIAEVKMRHGIDAYRRLPRVRYLSTNVTGFFLMTQRALELMGKQGHGHVVTITTRGIAPQVSPPGWSVESDRRLPIRATGTASSASRGAASSNGPRAWSSRRLMHDD